MPKKKEKRDIPQILHTLVNKRYNSLKKFWSEQIGDVKQIASLSHTESIEALDSPSFKTLEFKFQDEVAERIMTFMHKHNLTLFQFFISVYQLLLYGETNSKIIPVFSSVDMRIHDERLRDAFGRCINTVPFVASFREDVSVLDFFLSNSKIAILTTEHSVYPFSMILEEIKEQKLRKHFRRHALVIDDITMIEQLKQSNEKRIDIKNVWLTTFAMKETALRIIHDTQSKMIRGEFEYNQRICSNTRGEKILSDLLSLVERCIWHQNQAISLVIKGTANHVVMNSQSLETREKVQGDSDDSINDQPKLPLGDKTPSNQVSSTVVPPNGESYFLTRDEENPAGEPDVTIHNKTILKSGMIITGFPLSII